MAGKLSPDQEITFNLFWNTWNIYALLFFCLCVVPVFLTYKISIQKRILNLSNVIIFCLFFAFANYIWFDFLISLGHQTSFSQEPIAFWLLIGFQIAVIWVIFIINCIIKFFTKKTGKDFQPLSSVDRH